MKLDKINKFFTHICGEDVTNREILYTVFGLMTLLFICGVAEGLTQ